MHSAITPELVYELVSVTSPSVSPDGKRLAFVRSHVDRQSAETRSQIMMMDIQSKEVATFTGGKSDSSPRFSPDGCHLAFVRPDDAGKPQIWTMPTNGGEAHKLTEIDGGVTDIAWSPDSGALAFVSDVDPDRAPDDYDPKREPRVSVAKADQVQGGRPGMEGRCVQAYFRGEPRFR